MQTFPDDRRAEVIDWLGGLLPEFDLPLDSSDEELREYLIDGTALCYTADKLMPGVLEVANRSQRWWMLSVCSPCCADIASSVGGLGWLCIRPSVKCEEVPLCCRGDGAARIQRQGS